MAASLTGKQTEEGSSSSSDFPDGFPYEVPMTLENVKNSLSKILSLTSDTDAEGTLRENWPSVQFINRITNRYSQVQRMKCRRKGRTDSPYDIYVKDQERYSELIREIRGNPRELTRIRKDILKKSPECSLFPISRVVYLMKYLFGDGLSTVKWIDMSAGWGDRLITAIALDLMEYRGYDPNEDMDSAYKKIIEELGDDTKYSVSIEPFETAAVAKDHFDIAFTSPPFFDYEIYSDSETQSASKYPTVKEWTEDFIIPYAKNAMNALRNGGYLVLYIEQHEDDYVIRLIEEFGEPNILYMGYDDVPNRRPFYIWQKGIVQDDMDDADAVAAATLPPPPVQDSGASGSAASGIAASAVAATTLPPLPIPAMGSGVGSDERPYGVLLLKAFGDLPVIGAFSLMTSGFLTDSRSIPGNTISHIQEEKIRDILGLDTEEHSSDTIVNVRAYNTLQHTDHRLAIEDLVRVLPRNAHALVEISTLPIECVERLVRIMIASGRRILVYRVIREAMPEHFPRSKDDLTRIRSVKGARASVVPGAKGQERFVHLTNGEYDLVHEEITNAIGHLKDLGGKPQDIIYNPADSLVRINNRVCELLTRDHIRTRGKTRILYEPSELLSDYVGEYKNGGSLREYNTRVLVRTGFIEKLVPREWESGESETLVVEPMRVKSGRRSMNITSHTEIVVKEPASGGFPFIPLSWHRGDLRTIQLHHEPLSTSTRVL